MESSATYKDRAIASLSGKWGTAAVATLIVMVIMYAASAASFGIIPILLLPLEWGFALFFLRVARAQSADYGTLFDGFKDYLRIFLTMLLQTIYTMLWMLLLIVPGIVKSYSYAMTSFVLADDPNIKYDAAIEESMRLMDGHKMQLFLIDLSMIGWWILSCLTFGIGFLFLSPYVMTTHAHFYEGLKAERPRRIE